MLSTVTNRFIRGIIRKGRLTEARRRHELGAANPKDWQFESATCWAVVCEEVIDTDHEPERYDAVFAELLRRRFSTSEIDEMRILAWGTAGWLNYDMMLWDWCHLDEKDMHRALDLKKEQGLIQPATYDRHSARIQKFLERDPVLKRKPRQAEQDAAPQIRPRW